ncbi:MAG TPA: acyl-CoA dehydrogenase, partial [Dehalococcoidia bacterium]|nr:acyl-CoA dehydrogenase [Dehalococcoidia bacterium]
MDILPNEEELMIKNSAREFFESECTTTLVREMEKTETGYSAELWSKMAEIGWLSLSIPESYGGSGFGLTTLGIVMSETGRVLAPVPFHSTMTAAILISDFGTEEQKERYLPSIADGSQIFTWAFSEEDPRYLPETVNTLGETTGEQLILNGTKMFVDNFEAADKIVV